MNPIVEPNKDTWRSDSMKLSTGNRIESVLAAIKDASSPQEVAGMMRDLRSGEDSTVVIGPYRLYFQTLETLEPEREGLLKVQPLNLSCAPTFVELIPIGDRHCVLVTKIDGVRDAELTTASFGMGRPITTEAVREALRSDVEKLKGAGLWNDTFDRWGAWLLNPETKSVILSSWSQVAMVDQQTLQQRCAEVLRMIDHA
jgi:hypothetical protein